MRELCQMQPAEVPQRAFSRMAGGGEGGGDENQFSAGAARANNIGCAMGRTSEQFVFGPDRAGPVAIAQMQAGLQGGGEAGIASNHKGEAASPADSCHRAAECCAVGIGVVPEDDAGNVRRQAGDEWERVGHACRIGEEPYGRVGDFTPLLYLSCPGG